MYTMGSIVESFYTVRIAEKFYAGRHIQKILCIPDRIE